MVKFPVISDNKSDQTFISFGDVSYAKHNIITKTSGKQIGYLTEHAVMFIIQGEKMFHFGEHTVCVKSSEILLVKRGVYTISEIIPENGCFEALIIFIPDKFLQTFYTQNSLAESTSEKKYTILNRSSLLKQFQSQYLNYFIGDFKGKQQLLQLKLKELFLLLQNGDSTNTVNLFIASCLNKENVDIEFVVNSNLFQPLSIEDYARLCSRSLATFKRDFKKQFNCPPKQWINQQRIFHSVSLLHTTKKSIAEVAFECGFESTSHFIKLFKKHIGITPKSSRAKIDIN